MNIIIINGCLWFGKATSVSVIEWTVTCFVLRLLSDTLSNYSTGCIKDYVQVFAGRSLDPEDGEYLSRNARNGKFCSSSQIYSSNYVYDNTATVYYHTDSSNTGSGTPRGLRVDFSTIGI